MHHRPTPLWAVLGVAFLASLGTGVIVNGIYFLTGFGRAGNYALGAVLGATYVLAALNASRILASVRHALPRASSRVILASMLIAIALLCAVPTIAPGGVRSWAAWLLAASYGLITGMMWPLIEGYVGGGRRGARLRYAAGQFNIWWASALVVAFVVMGPFTADHPDEVLLWLGVVHLGALALLIPFAPEPGRTGDVDHEPHPPNYPNLLRLFRIQLPTSYMVMGALSPYLPTAFEHIGVRTGWQTPIAATWLLSRVLIFILMERWHGWHGRWWVAIAGPIAMLAGFAATLLAAGFDQDGAPVLVIGLGVFGIGMGMIYSGAFYYAMEVGHEEVASGGTHEALIGSGYLTGPLTGLVVAWLVSSGHVPEAAFEPTKLSLVMVLCLVPALIGWWVVIRGRRRGARVADWSVGDP